MQQVVYIGSMQLQAQCSNPNTLVVGKVYNVRYTCSHNGQDVYALEEPNGFFLTSWFVPMETIPTAFAYTKQIPEAGKCFQCRTLILEHGAVRLSHASVSAKAQVVDNIGKDTYKVMTHGKLYIAMVVK